MLLAKLKHKGFQLLVVAVIVMFSITGAIPVSAAPGDYRFDNLNSMLCLDVADWGAYNGAKVQQWGCTWGWPAQQWYLTNPETYYDIFDNKFYTFYMVRSRASGRCLDVAGYSTDNGAKVHAWDCHGGSNQRWVWINEPRFAGTVALRALHSNKCLEVYGLSVSYGADVVQWDCWQPRPGPNQTWYWRNNN